MISISWPSTYTYKMVTWRSYLLLKGYERYLPPVGTCITCHAGQVPYVIVFETIENEGGVAGVADVCSEECFNMWLINQS